MSSGKRTRGPNKSKPWSRDPSAGTSVLRLALDVTDPRQRHRIESMFDGAHQIRRALQRGARDACRAYWAASHERATDPAALRDRLGLSKPALEHRAYEHLDAAPHLRHYVTKALAMHLADSVWTAVERHLFRDASGKRFGALHVKRWFDFTRLPGRARSHTEASKWETFRLHGSLAAHRAAYADAGGDFVQPRRLRAVDSRAWWRYDGPLAVVFSGLVDGTLVLPVRLPTAPSNQPILDHHLADASAWHKIDLVRRRDPHAPGGWRYEAHLLVLTQPYVAPAVAARRAGVAIDAMDRTAGIDVNVSNLTVASHDRGRAMRVTTIVRDDERKQRDRSRARRERRRARQIERSRRGANRTQYQLSRRQDKRARRREAAGLSPVDVIPMGPRKARTDGVPLQSFRRDAVSATYRRLRAEQAWGAGTAARSRRDRARQIARDVVATHGYHLIAEQGSIASWARSWGAATQVFSPGILLAAIDREARAVAALTSATGGVDRAATWPTALSQHCPCGARVPKRLGDRVHVCDDCGLRGDRDAVAAVLASFVVFVHKDDPASARVDYGATAEALDEIRDALPPTFSPTSSYQGWQDTLSESNGRSARDGSFVAWTMPTPDSFVVARRNVGTASCATRNEPGHHQTTSERARVRTNMSSQYPNVGYLRDTS